MKILFFMSWSGYARNFESTLRQLAQRGHTIHLSFDRARDKSGERRLIEALTRDFPSITQGVSPEGRGDVWLSLAQAIRRLQDYLRYLGPQYKNAPKLRSRVEIRVPLIVRLLAKLPPLRWGRGTGILGAWLRAMDRAIPVRREVREFIQGQKPDVLLVTPLVDIGSVQVDYIKAAKALGVRSALCVHSWDNLTNKGLIRFVPDMVTVWNEMMKAEAVELHGVPPHRVVVTGAQSYDYWFEWGPTTGRKEFCRKVGLPPDRPFILYLGSSGFVAPKEGEFAARWVERIRGAADPVLREAGILIRPHPQNSESFQGLDLSRFEGVAIWPPAGANPVDTASKTDYYDSLYHCRAVVGVNTSALIEAGIIGRPVHTLLVPEFGGGQTGTLHFSHLTQVNGGLLKVAGGFEEHLEHLAEALPRDPAEAEERGRRFVEAFVRPHGIDVPGTPRLLDAIDQLGASPAPAPEPVSPWLYPLRLLLFPLAFSSEVYQRARNHEKKRRKQKEKKRKRKEKDRRRESTVAS